MNLYTVRQEISSSMLLNGSTLLQSVPAKKKVAAETSFLQSAPTAMEALLLFRGTGYLNSCTQDCRRHARLHQETGGWMRGAFLLEKKLGVLCQSTLALEGLTLRTGLNSPTTSGEPWCMSYCHAAKTFHALRSESHSTGWNAQ